MTTLSMTNAQILNTIRQYAPNDYVQRVPEATQSDIANAIDGLNSYHANWDIFMNTFLQKIGMSLITDADNDFVNPYAKIFKRDPMMYGGQVEEVQMNLIKAAAYENSATDVFGVKPADYRVAYHRIGREDQYTVTTPLTDIMRNSFTDPYFLSNTLSLIPKKLKESDENDEYKIYNELFDYAYENGLFFNVNVDDVLTAADPEAAGKKLVKAIRAQYTKAKFFSPNYSAEGRARGLMTRSNNMVLIVSADVDSSYMVDVLSAAFNMDKAEFVADNYLVIDEFPESLQAAGAQAILVDRNFIIQTDTVLVTMASPVNNMNLSYNSTLTHMGIYSVSKFVPAFLFSTEASTVVSVDTPTVTSVTITDADGNTGTISTPISVAAPAVLPLSVTVAGTNNPSQAVVWTLSGFNGDIAIDTLPTGTYIDSLGQLHLSEDLATGTIIAVTATSVVDDSQSGTYVAEIA